MREPNKCRTNLVDLFANECDLVGMRTEFSHIAAHAWAS